MWFVLLNIKLSLYDVVDYCMSLFELRLMISLWHLQTFLPLHKKGLVSVFELLLLITQLVSPTEEIGDNEGVIRIRKSKEDRQHNCQKKKRTNDDLQNTEN